MAISFRRLVVSEPDANGVRHFVSYLDEENYNAAAIAVGSGGSLLPWDKGKNIRVTRLQILHVGTIGVTIRAAFTAEGLLQPYFTPLQITTAGSSGDVMEWDMDLMVQHDHLTTWLTIYPTGYAATDDIYFAVMGEVW